MQWNHSHTPVITASFVLVVEGEKHLLTPLNLDLLHFAIRIMFDLFEHINARPTRKLPSSIRVLENTGDISFVSLEPFLDNFRYIIEILYLR